MWNFRCIAGVCGLTARCGFSDAGCGMADPSGKAEHSRSAVGISVFAAAMLVMAGLSQAFTALAALVNDTVLVKVGGYIYAFDSTTWGWIHLLLGAALVVVGLFIFMAKSWAFIAGIILAIVNGLLNFLSLATTRKA
jgi:hypothetical protein